MGGWRVLVLTSECDEIGGCRDGSDEGRWLAGQPAAGTLRCTLAAWHRPRFSSGEEHGDHQPVAPLWAQLQKAGVDVVLNGHGHLRTPRAAGRVGEGGPARARRVRRRHRR
ncbi:MAG: hypothetical protein J0I49_04490 [Pseudonocardia sp.]|uniref:hypothetical protein n=1 Tax=Pseudonocardia sp. TaxID=60912 RepID=UPI001ACA731E|nr:hypothetical protein [Pseudonocardia sp.]MBN9097360.1 hypothetical protein [Pseudonocardia sp.]